MNGNEPRLLWQPSQQQIESSNLFQFIKWLKVEKGLHFDDYEALWNWSVEQTDDFWKSICTYFDVQFHHSYSEVLSSEEMPFCKWMEGATLNYAEHFFRNYSETSPAIIFKSEHIDSQHISWKTLKSQVGALQQFLKSKGVQKGDRVVGYLPNIPQASVSMLATVGMGAVWSSCSPDFGTQSVIERFKQIEPKVLIAVDGYQYGGKCFDKTAVVKELMAQIESIEHLILIPYSAVPSENYPHQTILWDVALQQTQQEPFFEAVPFGHPIWILFSSGTTGAPKAITHGHGGMLLEHLKYLTFHNDVRRGEKFFWFSTTGWMMWNYVHASALVGATIVQYDGSPGYPDISVLWNYAEEIGLEHFGTSAPFIIACMKEGLQPKAMDLSRLRSISSTGSPLPPEAFNYVFDSIKSDVWLASMSGGTDVCTAFVGGNPMLAVYEGEIQCRALGCALMAYNESGEPVWDEVGEMVIEKPMPCMPVFFWNDDNREKYLESYFTHFAGKWRHGDWVKITPRNGLVIFGRSDATLNRQGVRIGTAEIYRAVDSIPSIKDSLIVNLEKEDGTDIMPLFVVMKEGYELDDALKTQLRQTIRSQYSPRHVPDIFIEVEDIPYTISGKKMEMPVKKILMGVVLEKAANQGAMRNPESLKAFVEMRGKY